MAMFIGTFDSTNPLEISWSTMKYSNTNHQNSERRARDEKSSVFERQVLIACMNPIIGSGDREGVG